MNCAKLAELIDMQFGMLSQMGAANHLIDVGVHVLMGRGTFGVVWPIEKHRILLFVVDTHKRLGCVEGVELGDWSETCNIAQSHGRSDVLAIQ